MTVIDDIIKQLHKVFGPESVNRMGQAPYQSIPAIPTGSLALDLAIGIGGIPCGRITELYGPAGGGKTTIALHAAAECQKMGGEVLYVDLEQALDPTYMRAIGVDIDNLVLSQPDCAETALGIAEKCIREGGVKLVIIDSVAALVPRVMIDGDLGDAHVGVRAKLLSQAIARLAQPVKAMQVAVIFINQLRAKIGGFTPSFGGWEPVDTPGGYALKHHAKVRISVRSIGTEKDNTGQKVSSRTKVIVKKNQVAIPYREAEFELEFGKGISKTGDILDTGLQLDIIEKRGSHWYFKDGDEELKLGHGRQNTKDNLEGDALLLLKIENDIRRKVGLPIKLEE